MSLNRYSKQRDANEGEIVEALEKAGATVERLDRPVDLLVGYRGVNYLFEIKLPPGAKGGVSHSSLNDSQRDFFLRWDGRARVVRSPQEALAFIGCRVRS